MVKNERDNNIQDYLMTPTEVARLLRVSKKTIYRHIKSGKLKAIKIGQWKIKKTDLDNLLK